MLAAVTVCACGSSLRWCAHNKTAPTRNNNIGYPSPILSTVLKRTSPLTDRGQEIHCHFQPYFAIVWTREPLLAERSQRHCASGSTNTEQTVPTRNNNIGCHSPMLSTVFKRTSPLTDRGQEIFLHPRARSDVLLCFCKRPEAH